MEHSDLQLDGKPFERNAKGFNTTGFTSNKYRRRAIPAFGRFFLTAAVLKLVHDSLLFVGPQLLNALINFLNDPSEPMSTGLWYVFGLFTSNLVMSLCLRQYFW